MAKKIFLFFALIIFAVMPTARATDNLPFEPLAMTSSDDNSAMLILIRMRDNGALYFVAADNSTQTMARVDYSRKIYDFYLSADEHGLYSPMIFEMALPNQQRGQLDEQLGEWRQNIHIVPVYALFEVQGEQIICDKPFFSATYLNPSHYHDRIQNPVYVRLIEILLTHMPRLHEQIAAQGVVLP